MPKSRFKRLLGKVFSTKPQEQPQPVKAVVAAPVLPTFDARQLEAIQSQG